MADMCGLMHAVWCVWFCCVVVCGRCLLVHVSCGAACAVISVLVRVCLGLAVVCL